MSLPKNDRPFVFTKGWVVLKYQSWKWKEEKIDLHGATLVAMRTDLLNWIKCELIIQEEVFKNDRNVT